MKMIDQLLKKVIGDVEAGACIPEMGQPCRIGCRWGRYNCYGRCV